MKINKINPFNNNVETGLRMLCILNESFPKSFDLQKLIYLDYLTVHSGDIDKTVKSIHPSVPYRIGEIFVRRSIIQDGLNLFIKKNLIQKVYTNSGIFYKASENSTPFLEVLEEDYFKKLKKSAKWSINKFSDMNSKSLKLYLQKYVNRINNEFNIEILE